MLPYVWHKQGQVNITTILYAEHTHTHTHAHTHAHIHTHTRTHVHAHAYTQQVQQWTPLYVWYKQDLVNVFM